MLYTVSVGIEYLCVSCLGLGWGAEEFSYVFGFQNLLGAIALLLVLPIAK
jgi:hypothetical protein